MPTMPCELMAFCPLQSLKKFVSVVIPANAGLPASAPAICTATPLQALPLQLPLPYCVLTAAPSHVPV